ncbi:MAG: hypothetical protein SGI88_11660 [Candidatus Hydrogenedentes bacterium]|nr:hypothetical protein [Candidatus Hydrogenedentota bacterium]
MRAFDHDYVSEVIARAGRVKPDARAVSGIMTRNEMLDRLAGCIRMAMGSALIGPDASTWFSRSILRPLVLHGFIPLPRAAEMLCPVPAGAQPNHVDLETLHALLETYLDRVHTGDLVSSRHPIFGEIGIDGWARLHVVHFERLLRRFGV